MAGELVALLQLVRMRAALVATVTSPEFIATRSFQGLAGLFQIPEFWKYAFSLLRSQYAIMRTLRLADCKGPGMDKLYYYVMQADRCNPKYLKHAEQLEDAPWMTDDVIEVLDSTKDAASFNYDGRG